MGFENKITGGFNFNKPLSFQMIVVLEQFGSGYTVSKRVELICEKLGLYGRNSWGLSKNSTGPLRLVWNLSDKNNDPEKWLQLIIDYILTPHGYSVHGMAVVDFEHTETKEIITVENGIVKMTPWKKAATGEGK